MIKHKETVQLVPPLYVLSEDQLHFIFSHLDVPDSMRGVQLMKP